MNLLNQSGDNCFLYAAAMVLDIEPQKLITLIGHDGTEIWWPDQVGSKKQRSIHPQELLDAAVVLKKTFICIEFIPRTGWDKNSARLIFDKTMVPRFAAWIKDRYAILIVRGSGLGHAVAWDGKSVYDPKGFVQSIEEYEIAEAWVLVDLI